MRRKRKTNPRFSRTSTGPLYRGVSPGEYVDIIRTGRIVGRGNVFSGDPRSNMVFFGLRTRVGMDNVLANQGGDVTRYVAALPEIAEMARAEADLARRLRELDPSALAAWHRGGTPEVRRLKAEHKKAARLLDGKFSKLIAAHERARKRAGVWSLVLRLDDVSGGTVFTGEDSAHADDEVGFDRGAGVSVSGHLGKVYIYDENGLRAELEGEEALDMKGVGGKLLRLAEKAALLPPTSGQAPRRRRNPMNVVTFILWDTIGRDVAKHAVNHVKKRVNGAMRRRKQ